MDMISLSERNIVEEHICCAIGDPKTRAGVELKKAWLRERFQDGLMFKKINVQGKAFIEYIPAENAWAPIDAPGYMFVNCFWVAGKFKGQGIGSRLLAECISDAEGKNGIVIISSHKKRPYLSEKRFLLKKGFEVCDIAPPYFELLVKRFNDKALPPRFKDSVKGGEIEDKDGLTVIYSDQCPYVDFYTHSELSAIGQQYAIPIKLVKLHSKEEAQNTPAVYSTYTAFYKGKFLTHEILTKNKFEKLYSSLK